METAFMRRGLSLLPVEVAGALRANRAGVSETSPKVGVGEDEMRREIGLFLAALIVVNSTIGTGIFKTPAQVARLTDSLGLALGVWVVGGVIALCGALSMAELSASRRGLYLIGEGLGGLVMGFSQAAIGIAKSRPGGVLITASKSWRVFLKA